MKLARRLQTEDHTHDNDITNATNIDAENVTTNVTNDTELKSDSMSITDKQETSSDFGQQGNDPESKEISKRSVEEQKGLCCLYIR